MQSIKRFFILIFFKLNFQLWSYFDHWATASVLVILRFNGFPMCQWSQVRFGFARVTKDGKGSRLIGPVELQTQLTVTNCQILI